VSNGIGSHTKPNRGANDLWLTPPALLSALGRFDIDPCACPDPRPFDTAKFHISRPDDGLAFGWRGRVWCNPPYGPETTVWLERMAKHNWGTALVFARTETDAWQRWIWPYAKAILFIKGRLHFHFPDGSRAPSNAGGPSALVAYGNYDAAALRASGIQGCVVSPLPITRSGRRCALCELPIKRHHRHHFVGSRVQHNDCTDPELKQPQPSTQESFLKEEVC
jgi:DNA N-6-adenine-methyltransferase (Dam)